jgi:oligopeptide/dipeptide ABC transporter ATP-binding protein
MTIALDRPVTTTSASLLELDDVVVRYPVRRTLGQALRRVPRRFVNAVDGVSLSVAPGEMLALVGESGCGKTSIAQTALRLIDPAEGRIRFEGSDVTTHSVRNLRPLRQRMQMIYQDPYESLDPRFRVHQTIEEPLLIHGIGGGKSGRRNLVLDALERTGLTPPDLFAQRYPHELSGGQRQRVSIAASLVLDPRLLIADEPVSMLDVSVRAGILRLLDKLRREQGMGILMITHDLSTAAHFADRIAVMYLGRIVEEGPARRVIQRPLHPYTQALLSVVPPRDPRHKPTPQILQGEVPDPTNVPSGCRFHPRCPLAMDECTRIDPALRSAAGDPTDEHTSACILVGPGHGPGVIESS